MTDHPCEHSGVMHGTLVHMLSFTALRNSLLFLPTKRVNQLGSNPRGKECLSPRRPQWKKLVFWASLHEGTDGPLEEACQHAWDCTSLDPNPLLDWEQGAWSCAVTDQASLVCPAGTPSKIEKQPSFSSILPKGMWRTRVILCLLIERCRTEDRHFCWDCIFFFNTPVGTHGESKTFSGINILRSTYCQ